MSFYIPLYCLSNHNNYLDDMQGKKDFAAEVAWRGSEAAGIGGVWETSESGKDCPGKCQKKS